MSLLGVGPPRCDDEQVSRGRTLRAAITAGAGAGAWSGVITLAFVTLIVLAAWVAVPHGTSDVTDALRSAGLGFVLVNGAPLHMSPAWITIPLLGLAFIPAAVVRWAVGRSMRALDPSTDTVVGLVIGTSVMYAVMVGLVAWLASTPTVGSPPYRAAGWGAGVAVVGVLWATGFVWSARDHLRTWPEGARTAVRASLISISAMVSASFFLVAVSLVMGASTVIALFDSLHPGMVGSSLLFLLGLGWLPAFAGWSWSYLVGSGFSVGAHTSVLPTDVHLGAVPAFPWLGALPSGGLIFGSLLIVVPIIAGALMYPVLSKSGGLATAEAFFASAIVGVFGAFMAWVGHGSIGPGRLALAGPLPLATGLRTFAFVALGSLALVGLRTVVRVAISQVNPQQDEVPSRVGTAA